MNCCAENSITVVYEGMEKFLEIEYYPHSDYQPGTWILQFCNKCKQHWWLDTNLNQDIQALWNENGRNTSNDFAYSEKYLTDKDRQEISNRIRT